MCYCAKGHRKPKSIPYGSTKGAYWCWGCDAALVPDSYGPNPKPIKKSERKKAKDLIREELKRIGK